MRLHLASTSPARLASLRSAGIEPAVIPSRLDEVAAVAEAERDGALGTEDVVRLLARRKAEAVVDAVAEDPAAGLLLGGDSAFELDGVTYGKPHEPEVARERWRLQRGRTGRLYSGMWLIDMRGGRAAEGERPAVGAVAVATVTFAADVTDAEIDAYIATGEPLEVAGAFTLERLGGAFVTGVSGDPSTVVGLSLSTLRRMVHELGVDWTSLWNRPQSL